MPFPVVEDGTQLAEAIRGAAQEWKKHEKEIEDFIYLYTGSCDGNATERILKLAGTEKTDTIKQKGSRQSDGWNDTEKENGHDFRIFS